MQNHPRISAGSQLGICPFTSVALSHFVPVSRFGYQRYIRRASFNRSEERRVGKEC